MFGLGSKPKKSNQHGHMSHLGWQILWVPSVLRAWITFYPTVRSQVADKLYWQVFQRSSTTYHSERSLGDLFGWYHRGRDLLQITEHIGGRARGRTPSLRDPFPGSTLPTLRQPENYCLGAASKPASVPPNTTTQPFSTTQRAMAAKDQEINHKTPQGC